MGSGDPMGKAGEVHSGPSPSSPECLAGISCQERSRAKNWSTPTPAPKTQPVLLRWSRSQEPPAPRNSASWKATITHADQAAQHSVKIQSLGVCGEAQKRRENTTVKHSDSFPQSRLATSSPPLQRGAASSRRENGAEG